MQESPFYDIVLQAALNEALNIERGKALNEALALNAGPVRMLLKISSLC